jgi:phosphoribosylaminoimidazole carboxylase PurE protein
MDNPKVGIIMGSDSDLEVMSEACKVLDQFGVTYETRIVSAHRTPDVMEQYSKDADGRGLKVIIAGAGGSAHLPGMTASETFLPVIAVPINKAGKDQDNAAFWSNIKMPPGIPLATMPENGSKNAALLAVRILSLNDEELKQKYIQFVSDQHQEVVNKDDTLQQNGWESYLSNK